MPGRAARAAREAPEEPIFSAGRDKAAVLTAVRAAATIPAQLCPGKVAALVLGNFWGPGRGAEDGSGAGRAWEGSRARLGRLRRAGAVGPAWERGGPAVFGAAERVLPGEKRGRAALGEVSVRRGGD